MFCNVLRGFVIFCNFLRTDRPTDPGIKAPSQSLKTKFVCDFIDITKALSLIQHKPVLDEAKLVP